MRRAICLLLLLFFLPYPWLSAQTVYQQMQAVFADPTGQACTVESPVLNRYATGQVYNCQNISGGIGAYGAINGASGTFNALSGDATSTATGGLTTVVGIRSTSIPALASGLLQYTGTAFAWLATTGSGNAVRATSPTMTSVIINGSPSGTGVSQTGGPGTLAQRDGSNNLVANNFLASATVVTAAAGTTTLTVGSSRYQFLVGTTTQTFQLPSATTVVAGTSFWFNNNSTGTMTVNDGAGGLIVAVPPTGMANVVLQAAGSTAGTWDQHTMQPTGATLFANLPACSTSVASRQYWITDSSTQVWGATVTGTGTPATPYTLIGCDGINWTVIGK